LSFALANEAWVIAQVMASTLQPAPAVDLEAWACEHVVFGSESPVPGRYDPKRFPYFSRILEVLGPEHPARVVTLMKSAQIGGTVLAQIFVGGSSDLDPSPILYVHPTEGNAGRWAKTKWRPFVRGTAPLRELFPMGSSRDQSSSTLFYERRDGRGFLQVSGANSEASLSMISMPRQVQDDLSKWELNNAGDPETQADSRSKAFEHAKILKIGTPLIEDSCRITKSFMRSTQEHFHLPCPGCGHFHPLEWENMLGRLDEMDPAAASFLCPACTFVIQQRHRHDMLGGGRWVAHNPGAAEPGFHLWAAYSPLESFSRIAVAWFAAKGDPAREQAFLNDTAGLPFKAVGEAPPWEGLRDRAEASSRARGIVPLGGLLLTMGLDCQDDRVEWQLVAWGPDYHRYVVDYGVVEGSITETTTRAKLDRLMERRWLDFQRQPRDIDMAAIDGNAWTEEVLDWVKRQPESVVMMVRGARSDQAPPLQRVKIERTRDGKVRKYGRRFYNVGASQMKLALYKNLQKADPLQRGYVDLPRGLDDQYFRQLTAEKRVGKRRPDGFVQFLWVKAAGERNEALDTMIYAEAAAVRIGWRSHDEAAWERLRGQLEAPVAAPQLDLEDMLATAPARPEPAAREPAEQSRPPAAVTPPPAAPSSWLERRQRWL
jgi:phage terminase large subunit GpA-like protein